MSDNSILANSIWPNGIKVDSDGYAIFYGLGTNKISVPVESEWPKGDKLVSPFVYENGKLVGFCDTKAMTVSGVTTITLPYSHIEADFSSIEEGDLVVNAPNATVVKYKWAGSEEEGGGEVGDIIITLKYKGCKTVDDVRVVDANYLTTDIVDGVWSEGLGDLEDGYNMFSSNLNLETFKSDLNSLTITNNMFNCCYNLTSFDAPMRSLQHPYEMFFGSDNIEVFISDLSSLTVASELSLTTEKLTKFEANLGALIDGRYMFHDCKNLTTFECGNLNSLEIGDGMFSSCTNFATFNYDLSSLTSGEKMFYNCTALTTFVSDLSSLETAYGMFASCANLATFTTDLSSLTNGCYMFHDCKNLTIFDSDLSSLNNGWYMFGESTMSKLNTQSVQNIARTIKDVNGLTNNWYDIITWINIGIGNTTPNSEEIEAFNTIASKGWEVFVNGSTYTPSSVASTMTLDETGEEVETPIPFYAKPIPSDEAHAKYVDTEGNYYNILGAQFIYGDDLSTYGMFTCLDDAAANMRLTPYVKPQTEIENQ